ncbi:hypothetical protein CALVIDRAFT_595343 [Calocera viscosa TUFC12733]|uniref:Uncharacterized protein n=1 Tax=Calocera viscosa (strain TUFC12733) TaxID=1330018 RepID=A0A167R4P9_CALVF|nr:hypothetical protein CALVIDRAFT_595343 [Calocera viscosa TUFC12733]
MERYSTTTRKELFSDLNGTESMLDTDLDRLAALQDTVKSRLALDPIETLESTASALKKPKRKRKIPVTDQGEPVFEFKLVSGSSQPQTISLVEPDVIAVTSNRPTHEDTPEEEERRSARVQLIAVDSTWLAKEASAVWPSPKPHKQPIAVKVDAKINTVPAVFIAERQLRAPAVRERPAVGAEAKVPILLIH